MSVTLLLVRHGQTKENVAHVLQGQTPGTLTHVGINQARDLSHKLIKKRIDQIISSDLQRALDTANIINENLHLPITTDVLLRERQLGPYTGQPYGIEIDSSIPGVESVEDLYNRGDLLIKKLLQEHCGKTLLIISHGLFLRVLQASFFHKKISDIIPMENTEVRELIIDDNYSLKKELTELHGVEK